MYIEGEPFIRRKRGIRRTLPADLDFETPAIYDFFFFQFDTESH